MKVGIQSQIEVGQRLSLNTLRGIHQKHSTLAGGQGARDLVSKVHMARRVDHVQDIGLSGIRVAIPAAHPPRHPNGLGFDGDPALPLDIHAIEVLSPHRALVDDTGQLQHPVGQSRLAMIDMRDDAEVADD